MKHPIISQFLVVAALICTAACTDSGGPTSPTVSPVRLSTPASTSPSAVTVLPQVTSTAGSLADGAIHLAGDTLILLGNTTDSLGSTLPNPLGSSVVLVGSVVGGAGTGVNTLGDSLASVLTRIGTLSINPLLGSNGLLTSVLAATLGPNGLVPNIVQPLIQGLGGRNGLLAPALNITKSLPLVSDALLPSGQASSGALSPVIGGDGLLGPLLAGGSAPSAGSSGSGGGLLSPLLSSNGLLGNLGSSGGNSSNPSTGAGKGLLGGLLSGLKL